MLAIFPTRQMTILDTPNVKLVNTVVANVSLKGLHLFFAAPLYSAYVTEYSCLQQDVQSIVQTFQYAIRAYFY